MKHFKFKKKEYVIIEKDILEDALYTAIAITRAYGDPALTYDKVKLDINKLMTELTVEDVTNLDEYSASAYAIVDNILNSLKES